MLTGWWFAGGGILYTVTRTQLALLLRQAMGGDSRFLRTKEIVEIVDIVTIMSTLRDYSINNTILRSGRYHSIYVLCLRVLWFPFRTVGTDYHTMELGWRTSTSATERVRWRSSDVKLGRFPQHGCTEATIILAVSYYVQINYDSVRPLYRSPFLVRVSLLGIDPQQATLPTIVRPPTHDAIDRKICKSELASP